MKTVKTAQEIAELQAARLKNVRISHKKAAEFGLTLDLAALVNRALSEADQCKPNAEGEVKSYNLASTGGFISLTAPGFEDVQVSVNVITSKVKYDALIKAEKAAAEAAKAPVAPSAPAPAADPNMALMAMIQQQQAMMAQMQEQITALSAPKSRKKAVQA